MSSKEDLNTLHFILVRNSLIKDREVNKAVVQNVFTINQESLIAELADETELSEDSVRHVFEAICRSIVCHAEKGHGIQTDMLVMKPTIKGSLEKNQTLLHYPEQRVDFKLSFGSGVKINYEKILTKRVVGTKHYIIMDSIEDGISNTIDTYLTSYGNLLIRGLELTFNSKNEDEGVFVIDRNGKEIKASKVFRNSRREIHVCTPKLEVGAVYSIELRKRFQHNSHLFIKVYPNRFTCISIGED